MGIPDKRTKSLQHLALDGFIEPAAGRPVRVEDSMFPIWRTITLLNANDVSPKLFEVCFKLFRFSCRKDHLDFQNPTISENHPARNASPPIGVTAPNHLKPVNAIMYRLPENSATPVTKNHPACLKWGLWYFCSAHPASARAKA